MCDNNMANTVLSLASKSNLDLTTKEPEWFKEFRTKVWNAFQLLPLESDPNMLNFLQTKILNDFQFSYPPVGITNPKTILNTSSEDKIELVASPENEQITISTKFADNQKLTFENLYSLVTDSDYFIDLLNSLLELKIGDKLLSAALATVEWGTYLKIDSSTTIEEIINLKLENPTHSIKSGLHIIDIRDAVDVQLILHLILTKILLIIH